VFHGHEKKNFCTRSYLLLTGSEPFVVQENIRAVLRKLQNIFKMASGEFVSLPIADVNHIPKLASGSDPCTGRLYHTRPSWIEPEQTHLQAEDRMPCENCGGWGVV